MIRIGESQGGVCQGLTRREWLRVGSLAPLGISLADLLLAGDTQAATRPVRIAAPSFGRAKSCIIAFLFGAPAHQDLWDLKPDAPREVRGEFRPIRTSVNGIEIGEHLPLTAQQAHRYSIVRSVTHPDNTHTVAMHYMLTGVRHRNPGSNPQNEPTDFPCFGAVAQHQLARVGPLPASVSLNSPANQVSASNHIFPGFFAGWLGNHSDPLFINQNAHAAGFRPFETPELLTPQRLLRRQRLLGEVDRHREALSNLAAVRSLRDHQDAALNLVTAPAARRAFDLSLESPTLRERYGSSAFGQGLLLARRLVESGVRLVTVNWARDDAFWDTHAQNFKSLKDDLLPPFDRGFSALLEDLATRGLLDETLVVCLGEFGRTPEINKNAGRDHWAACNSVVLAGGGMKSGFVYGKSDRIAAYPDEDPVTPEELAATIYHALGIAPGTELMDPQGRPVPLCTANPVRALFA
ncbi:MAG: hypothetical protein K0Q72_2450 [Armatimonadetes bacterium]|jgi:hypothetical protein|nr:hypothetical protein [Armatimonadota bacterium]